MDNFLILVYSLDTVVKITKFKKIPCCWSSNLKNLISCFVFAQVMTILSEPIITAEHFLDMRKKWRKTKRRNNATEFAIDFFQPQFMIIR